MTSTLSLPITLHQYAIIEKVDHATRTVTGWAISEQSGADHQNDRILFSAALEAFQIHAPTLGIREMHQPKAVARLVEWWPDEPNKRIGIRVQVSKSRDGDDVWTKITEGILRGFSIGGKALEYMYEGVIRVISKLRLIEISLVDVPADPAAVITFFKSDDANFSKAVDDAPGLRHAEPVDFTSDTPQMPRQCSTCSSYRQFSEVPYCRRYDFKTQADWTCDGFELAATPMDADADGFIPLSKNDQTQTEVVPMDKEQDKTTPPADEPVTEVAKASTVEQCAQIVKDAMALMDSDPAKASSMLKDAAEALASGKKGEETSTPVLAKQEGKDTETVPEPEAETQPEVNDMQKAFAAIAQLTSQVSVMSQGMQELQKTLTASAVQPVQTPAPKPGSDTLSKADVAPTPKADLPTRTPQPVKELDNVQKAIMAGDIDGAITAAGSRGMPYVMDQMDMLVKASLAEAGVGLNHAFILSQQAA